MSKPCCRVGNESGSCSSEEEEFGAIGNGAGPATRGGPLPLFSSRATNAASRPPGTRAAGNLRGSFRGRPQSAGKVPVAAG